MMVFCINASGARCYHPAWSVPLRVSDVPLSTARAETMHLPDRPVAPAAAPIPAAAVPETTDPSSGILTPGVTLDITMHNGSVFNGELITVGGFVPVRLKQSSGIYTAGQVVRLNSKVFIALA